MSTARGTSTASSRKVSTTKLLDKEKKKAKKPHSCEYQNNDHNDNDDDYDDNDDDYDDNDDDYDDDDYTTKGLNSSSHSVHRSPKQSHPEQELAGSPPSARGTIRKAGQAARASMKELTKLEQSDIIQATTGLNNKEEEEEDEEEKSP